MAFLDLAQQAHFYSYGFAFPVWNNGEAVEVVQRASSADSYRS